MATNLLGRLLRNRRAGETHMAWHLPGLQGPDLLTVTSEHFTHGEPMPLEHAGKLVGGSDLSPHLSWSPPPPDTAQLLLIVEDTDVPTAKPAVHCLALIDPARLTPPDQLPAGALSARQPAAGVQVLRSTIGRGYHGPGPIKGHGPHHYTFQLFALAADIRDTAGEVAPERARPRSLLSSVQPAVLARGRITGTYER
jgi:hypothetical protein